jgi:DNA-binding beta-propeller fold protein YncE
MATYRTLITDSCSLITRLLCLSALVVGCSPDPGTERQKAKLESRFFSRAEVIGSRGVAPGQFNKPRSVVCDREDNLYVVDMTGRVQKFSPDGTFLLQWQLPETDLGRPKGMGLDRDGNILVIEPHYQRVNHFTPAGKLVAQWGIKGTNVGQLILPRAIAQNSKGDFVVSEYTVVERVQVFPGTVATNAAGANAERPTFNAQRSRESLATVTSWGTPGLGEGEFNRPEGLGLGTNDTVFVADSCNHRIQVFSAEGRFLRAFGGAGSGAGEFSYPYDVKLDATGNCFVCEFGNSRITALDARDRVIEVIGKAGRAPGEFANPWGIAFDSKGNLYVADAMNHRVQKLVRR